MNNDNIRVGFVFACVIILLIICFIAFGCKHSDGQPVPASQSDTTAFPSTFKILTIEGVLSWDNYSSGSFCYFINDTRISEDDVVIVYLNLLPDICVWTFYSNYAFQYNYVVIYDHHCSLIDVRYRIRIIKGF